MKIRIIFSTVLIVLITILSVSNVNSQDLVCSTNHEHNGLKNNSQTVYICTSITAQTYHSRSDCPGLGNCLTDINYVDENYAINNLSRVPCCRCWSNVVGRCKDDNPYYTTGSGSVDNSEAYAYLAIVFIAIGVPIISNDIYVYPTYSLYKDKNESSDKSTGKGLAFGFRKTFEHSALEYGASYLETKFEDYNRYGTYSYEEARWGGHFNFVQQLFYNTTPDWLRFYIGPSVNYVYEFGYGGIVGTEMRIFDRLKFDVRYEYTTQTNQIQAGLIFTYQKEYFWNK